MRIIPGAAGELLQLRTEWGQETAACLGCGARVAVRPKGTGLVDLAELCHDEACPVVARLALLLTPDVFAVESYH